MAGSEFLQIGPLEQHLPRLASSRYEVTSDATNRYNCLAWALGDATRWWAPVDGQRIYWPAEVPREWSLATVQAVLRIEGFALCEDGAPLEGIEKVALYADEVTVTHVARQLPSGRWTSKLGSDCDIEHELEALEGFDDSPDAYRYGRVVAFMSRARR